jgi:hypothetical protein
MPLYAIRRNVGPMTADEVDAAAFRAVVCGYEFPGLRWVRSYWSPEREVIDCYYEAVDERQIREHAFKSHIPCDSVSIVTELSPYGYAHDKPAEEPVPVAT